MLRGSKLFSATVITIWERVLVNHAATKNIKGKNYCTSRKRRTSKSSKNPGLPKHGQLPVLAVHFHFPQKSGVKNKNDVENQRKRSNGWKNGSKSKNRRLPEHGKLPVLAFRFHVHFHLEKHRVCNGGSKSQNKTKGNETPDVLVVLWSALIKTWFSPTQTLAYVFQSFADTTTTRNVFKYGFQKILQDMMHLQWFGKKFPKIFSLTS